MTKKLIIEKELNHKIHKDHFHCSLISFFKPQQYRQKHHKYCSPKFNISTKNFQSTNKVHMSLEAPDLNFIKQTYAYFHVTWSTKSSGTHLWIENKKKSSGKQVRTSCDKISFNFSDSASVCSWNLLLLFLKVFSISRYKNLLLHLF